MRNSLVRFGKRDFPASTAIDDYYQGNAGNHDDQQIVELLTAVGDEIEKNNKGGIISPADGSDRYVVLPFGVFRL